MPHDTEGRKRLRARRRAELITGYGGHCACCGESTPAFLTLDHINGLQGKKRVTADKLVPRLRAAGWPRDEYRLLCWNCNCARHFNNGVCPHKT